MFYNNRIKILYLKLGQGLFKGHYHWLDIFPRMTVVQSYICEVLSKTTPKFSSIPPNVANLIIHGISVNSAYTSRIMVRLKSVEDSRFLFINRQYKITIDFVKFPKKIQIWIYELETTTGIYPKYPGKTCFKGIRWWIVCPASLEYRLSLLTSFQAKLYITVIFNSLKKLAFFLVMFFRHLDGLLWAKTSTFLFCLD